MHCFKIVIPLEMETVIYMAFNYSVLWLQGYKCKEQQLHAGSNLLAGANVPIYNGIAKRACCFVLLFSSCCAAYFFFRILEMGSAASLVTSIKNILIAIHQQWPAFPAKSIILKGQDTAGSVMAQTILFCSRCIIQCNGEISLVGDFLVSSYCSYVPVIL